MNITSLPTAINRGTRREKLNGQKAALRLGLGHSGKAQIAERARDLCSIRLGYRQQAASL
jgi:hypothetical protein